MQKYSIKFNSVLKELIKYKTKWYIFPPAKVSLYTVYVSGKYEIRYLWTNHYNFVIFSLINPETISILFLTAYRILLYIGSEIITNSK